MSINQHAETVEHYDSANCDCVPRHEYDALRDENETLKRALTFAEGEVEGLADERLQRENRELRAELRVTQETAKALIEGDQKLIDRLTIFLKHLKGVAQDSDDIAVMDQIDAMLAGAWPT